MDMDDEDVKELGLSRVRSNALKTLMRQLREASLRFPRVLRSPFPSLVAHLSLSPFICTRGPAQSMQKCNKGFSSVDDSSVDSYAVVETCLLLSLSRNLAMHFACKTLHGWYMLIMAGGVCLLWQAVADVLVFSSP